MIMRGMRRNKFGIPVKVPPKGGAGNSKRKQMNFRPPDGTDTKFQEIHEYLHGREMSKSLNDTLAVIVNVYHSMIGKKKK
jgi:hypothetical protein